MDELSIINKFNDYISNYIKKGRINHAYLLETNFDNRLLLANELIKKLISFDDKITLEDMQKDNDITIIQSDTNTIKTEDIEMLKEKFKTKAIYGKYRIYIIDGAEKLNNYAANKLLKFIEEPEEDIIAILLTNNYRNIINTIVSRCQLFRFIVPNDKFNKYDNEYIDELFEFVMNIEENKENAIAFQNRYDIKKLSDRNYLQDFLNNMLYIYSDVIKYKINQPVEYFSSYEDMLNKISELNTEESLKVKINAINMCCSRIKFNPNIKLLIDKLVIEMNGVEFNE
jgi:DNA polymerase III delta prime subunit